VTRAWLQDDNKNRMTTLRTDRTTDFLCSSCGKRKGAAEDWLLGFEGKREERRDEVHDHPPENMGRVARQRAECCALLLHHLPDQLSLQELW